MTTFSAENWNKPTPKFWRDFGDLLLALSLGINPVVALMPVGAGWKVGILLISGTIGGVGKFLTKFFHNPKE